MKKNICMNKVLLKKIMNGKLHLIFHVRVEFFQSVSFRDLAIFHDFLGFLSYTHVTFLLQRPIFKSANLIR